MDDEAALVKHSSVPFVGAVFWGTCFRFTPLCDESLACLPHRKNIMGLEGDYGPRQRLSVEPKNEGEDRLLDSRQKYIEQ